MSKFARITISLSPKEESEVRKHAEAEGKSVSKFCREVLMNKTESGVILREPLEKEMESLNISVNERMLDVVKIIDRLSSEVMDRERTQQETITELKTALNEFIGKASESVDNKLSYIRSDLNNNIVTHIIEQNRQLAERVEFQNKLTRELYKIILYNVNLVGFFNSYIIEKAVDDKPMIQACKDEAEKQAAATMKELGV